MNQSAQSASPKPNEEPEITQEESVPSDGKDQQGEQMIKELGRDKSGPPPTDRPDQNKAT